VMFNLIPEKTSDDFWKDTGRGWSKAENDFLHENSEIKSAVAQVTAGSKTQDEALRKIYAKVMSLENTDYTREREKREDKAQGKREVKTASDVLLNQRGGGLQLTRLFVTMARAAGMKAYLVRVPNRTQDIFMRGWLSVAQFASLIALVNVDGKDVYLDPGEGDCSYGELPWQYTFVVGMRQTDTGDAVFITTPAPPFNRNKIERVGDLKMDAVGNVDGTVSVIFHGASALAWRHTAKFGDDESFRKDLKSELEGNLPNGFDVDITDVKQLADYELPLVILFHIHGPLAAKAGKRILVPADLFQAREKAMFSEPKRDIAVYFHYAEWIADAVRIEFPENMNVENIPVKSVLRFEQKGMYTLDTSVAGNSFTTQRDYAYGMIVVPIEKYAALRDFYMQFESKDQESVVLKTGL